MHRFHMLLCAIPVLFAPGCDSGESSEGQVVVRDSAALQIVESSSPTWGQEPKWSVDPDPVLEIGLVDGPEEYLLNRVGEAVLLSDRRIAATNRGSSEIRFFGEDGAFEGAVGGPGQGPGEFQWLKLWRAAGDSLLVYDASLARVSVLDPGGAFVRSVQVVGESGLGSPSAFGSTPDGGFLVTSGSGRFGQGERGLIEGHEIFFSHHDPKGEFQNVIASFPAWPRWAYTAGDRTTHMYVPHSVGWPAYAWDDRQAYLGVGRDPEIEVRDFRGPLTRLIRWTPEPQRITSPEIEEFKERWLASIEDANEKRYWRGWLDEVPFPEELPAFQSFLLDRSGHLWVEHYRPFWDVSPSWSVFSPDGVWLGALDTPAGLTITEIGPDYVLGVARDDLGVERIQLLRLIKTAGDQ